MSLSEKKEIIIALIIYLMEYFFYGYGPVLTPKIKSFCLCTLHSTSWCPSQYQRDATVVVVAAAVAAAACFFVQSIVWHLVFMDPNTYTCSESPNLRLYCRCSDVLPLWTTQVLSPSFFLYTLMEPFSFSYVLMPQIRTYRLAISLTWIVFG